jgi:RNA polymerase sigma-70 factor (ECF subfamily)
MLIALLPEMRGFARFLVRQRAEADDLVQEAVVRALAALPQFQEGTNLRAWVFRILRNAFYEQARRRRTEQFAIAQNFDEEEARDPAQSSHLELSDLQRALFRLSPTLREALVLVGAQGLSQEDAAVVCGVPVGTMRARVSRARAQLAEVMQDRARAEQSAG